MFFSTLNITFGEVVIDWDIKKLEDKFKSDIDEGLKEYLGSGKKFKVYVQVNGKKKTEEKKSINFSDKEFGYLSVADSYQDIRIDEKISVKSVSTEIFIYNKLEDESLRNVKKIAEGAIKGFPGSVVLRVMPSLKEEEKKIPFSLMSFLEQKASDVFYMLYYLVIGIISLFGVYYLLKSLLKLFNSSSKNKKLAKDDDKQVKQRDSEDKDFNLKINKPLNEDAKKHFERNMKIIETCLQESSFIFKKVLSQKNENLQGFKTLLPFMVSCLSKLGHIITTDQWKDLEKVRGLENDQFYKWLISFTEDILIAQMSEPGCLTSLVDKVLLEKVYIADPLYLIEAVRDLNSSVLYKFALDVLSEEKAALMIKEFDSSTWLKVLSEKEAKSEELNSDIKRMLKKINDLETTNRDIIADKDIERLFVPPTQLLLKGKTFEEVESLFEELSFLAPSLEKKLRTKVWTPKIFFRIPETYLSDKFNSMTLESRVMILLAVKEDVRDFLFSIMPNEKVSMIVRDQYSRGETALNSENKEKAILFARKFIEELKFDLECEKFNLKNEIEHPFTKENFKKRTDLENNKVA